MTRCTAIAAAMISLAIRFKSASVRIRDVSAEGVPQQNPELAGVMVYAVKEINHYSRINIAETAPPSAGSRAGLRPASAIEQEGGKHKRHAIQCGLCLPPSCSIASAKRWARPVRWLVDKVFSAFFALSARDPPRAQREILSLLRRLPATRRYCPDVADRND